MLLKDQVNEAARRAASFSPAGLENFLGACSFAHSCGLVSHFWLVARWALRGLYMRGFSRGGAAKMFRPAGTRPSFAGGGDQTF